jgi:2-polyprenyl-3-methyl-5-hydroxy-6-metoxy-1,4-benzoquinol methylase
MVYLLEHVGYEVQAQTYDWAETYVQESVLRDQRMPIRRAWSRGVRRFKRLCGREGGGKTIAMVRRYKREGRLCDFGCGNGVLLERAAPYFSICGIDISMALAAEARGRVRNAEIYVSPVTAARLPEMSLDVVTMQSYIEHEQRPLAALRVAYAALRPGGIVVVKVPNYMSWNRMIHGWKWCGFRFPDHCNYYTRRTLSLTLQKAGFQPLRGSIRDVLPTSDNMYLAARRPEAAATIAVAPPRKAAA